MADWDTLLTFVIAPKSGPLRKMVRLRDVQQALIADLPPGFLRRAHWLKAGKALVTAADTGDSEDIKWTFEAIVAALDNEGWLPQGASRCRRLSLGRLSLGRLALNRLALSRFAAFANLLAVSPQRRKPNRCGSASAPIRVTALFESGRAFRLRPHETICPGALPCRYGRS